MWISGGTESYTADLPGYAKWSYSIVIRADVGVVNLSNLKTIRKCRIHLVQTIRKLRGLTSNNVDLRGSTQVAT